MNLHSANIFYRLKMSIHCDTYLTHLLKCNLFWRRTISINSNLLGVYYYYYYCQNQILIFSVEYKQIKMTKFRRQNTKMRATFTQLYFQFISLMCKHWKSQHDETHGLKILRSMIFFMKQIQFNIYLFCNQMSTSRSTEYVQLQIVKMISRKYPSQGCTRKELRKIYGIDQNSEPCLSIHGK